MCDVRWQNLGQKGGLILSVLRSQKSSLLLDVCCCGEDDDNGKRQIEQSTVLSRTKERKWRSKTSVRGELRGHL